MICAGLVASGMVPAGIPQIQELGAKAPLGRIGQPEDLAGIVVYLMSDAARFHTGDLITVDGGAMASLY
jgi:3-oxoacyl-[acyl-carrier protein] reductase